MRHVREFNIPNDVRNCTPDELFKHVKSKNKEVRLYVSLNINELYLPFMIFDRNRNVRSEVSQRIDARYLPLMMNDKFYGVRISVARRIDFSYLSQMANDENEHVRELVEYRTGTQVTVDVKGNVHCSQCESVQNDTCIDVNVYCREHAP